MFDGKCLAPSAGAGMDHGARNSNVGEESFVATVLLTKFSCLSNSEANGAGTQSDVRAGRQATGGLGLPSQSYLPLL